jgi:hypothetical protein
MRRWILKLSYFSVEPRSLERPRRRRCCDEISEDVISERVHLFRVEIQEKKMGPLKGLALSQEQKLILINQYSRGRCLDRLKVRYSSFEQWN